MKSTAAFSILVIVLVIGSIKCNKTELIIASLTRSDMEPAIRGIKFAIQAAKTSSKLKSFLDKYEIKIVRFSTNEDPSNAIYGSSFFVGYRENGTALLVLGPQTPLEAFSVLQTVRFYRKLMVTYLTTTSDVKELEDPYGFTFAPSAFAFNKASIRMMEFFNWNRAAGLYDFLENGGLYVKVVDNLIKNADFQIIDFEAINTNFDVVKSVNDYIQEKLKKLRDLDTKIFFGEFNKRGARMVFCELYKMDMYGPEFVWILHADAGTIEEWQQLELEERKKPGYNNATKPCTKEEFRKAVEGAFIFDKHIAYRTDENTPTDSGLSLSEVFSHPVVQILTDIKKTEMATAFDTMWAVMLALKDASLELPDSMPLEKNVNNSQGEEFITQTITKKLKNLKFEGLTGPISFTDNEEREGIIAVRQFRNGTLVRIGTHFTKDDKFVLCCNFTKESLFKDGRIPFDSSQIEQVQRIVAPELFVIFSTASSIGIVLGIMFLVFNRYYRKYKFIRLSAPLFNDVMVVGCIMCLSTVFLFGLRDFETPETTMPPICKARAWILNTGFSLAFGAMFMKTWRIYKICTNKRLKVRLGPLSDWTMLAMVGGIVLIDVALLIAWEVEDPLKWTPHNFTAENHPDKPFVIITPKLNTCTSKYLTVWLALIYVYKGILLLYGLFLAYETRNVVYAHLNDSRVIGICVYNTVVLSTIGAFLALILNNEQYEQLYAALSVCIIFPATATISLIFIPKLMRRVKMDSLDGETGETTMHNTFTRPSIDMTSTVNDTEKGRERFVDATSTNTLCVYQNGEAGLSPIPSPSPPTTFQQLSPNTLED